MYLCDANSVQQLKPIKRKKLCQDFDILHMRLTVPTTIVLFGPVQPGRNISAQVPVVEAAHLERVEEDSKCGQQRSTCDGNTITYYLINLSFWVRDSFLYFFTENITFLGFVGEFIAHHMYGNESQQNRGERDKEA